MNREAMLVVTRPGSEEPTPVFDMDPIMVNNLPDALDFADMRNNPDLITLMTTVCEGEGLDPQAEYELVWSDTQGPVRGVCLFCCDVIRVFDAAPAALNVGGPFDTLMCDTCVYEDDQEEEYEDLD